MAHEVLPVINPGRVARPATRRDAILRLMDGRRTARHIADELGITDKNVRAVARKLGLEGKLRPASGAPIAARLPIEVVLRDLDLAMPAMRWLIAQTRNGATVQDVLRGIVTDAYLEETGL